MKSIITFCASLALMLFGFCQSANAQVEIPVRSYSKTLELTVAADVGIESALSAKGLTVADLAGYDCLVKTGAGCLTMDVDIPDFKGDIFIEEGKMDVKAALGLGMASTETCVVVRDDATLQWSAKVTYGAKTVYFQGKGCDGENGGALMTTDIGDNRTQITKDVVFVMTGNSRTRLLCTSTTARLFDGSTMYMNGYTNECYFGINGRAYYFNPQVLDQGTFDIRMGLVYFQGNISLAKGDEGEVGAILLNGCKISFNADSFPDAHWPLVVLKIPNNFFAHKESVVSWPGILEIAKGVTFSVSGDLTFDFGGYRGEGVLELGTGVKIDPTHVDSMISPDVHVVGDAGLTAEDFPSAAGLWAGYSSDLYPGGYEWCISNEWSDYRCFGSMPVLSNAVEVTDMPRLYKGVALAPTAEETGRQVYMYSGYIMNTEGADSTWAFSVNLKYYDYLVINGEVLFDDSNKANVQHVGTAVLHPGANSFLLRSYVSSSAVKAASGGPSSNAKDSTGAIFPGLGIIRDTNKSVEELKALNASDWTEITGDPGDGSLFRIAKDDDELRTMIESGVIGDGISTTLFRSISVADGAKFELGGRHVVVSNLSGCATFANETAKIGGSVLEIAGTWNCPAADVVAEKKLSSDQKISFLPGSVIGISDAQEMKGLDCPVAEAAGGILGDPNVLSTQKPKQTFEKGLSDDGKTLYVSPLVQGLIMLFR